VNRLGAGRLARGDDLFGDQVGLRGRGRADVHGFVGHLHEGRARIGIGIDRHGGNAHAACRLDHAAGDFATIGDEDFLEHHSPVPSFAQRRHVVAQQAQHVGGAFHHVGAGAIDPWTPASRRKS
jgi:hypothetical protein